MKNLSKKRDLARRAGLLLGLWLGFWLLSFGLVFGLLWIPFTQIKYGNFDVSGLISAIAAITLAYALRPRQMLNRNTEELPTWLSRATAPDLYLLVERVGAKSGLKLPVDIHLVSAATAYISAQRNWFGRIKSLRVGLGLPLFYLLSETELSTVIAHEFGHFARGDVTLGSWVYRTRNSIGSTVADLDESMFFLDGLFRIYGHWFLKLSSAVSRAQEFAADAHAAHLFGVGAARSALEKIYHIDSMWSAYFGHELGPAINRGARLPIFEGFRRFSLPGARRVEVQKAIDQARQPKTSIYDTHPSLEERVANLVKNAKPEFPKLAQCFNLLGGQGNAENEWYVNYDKTTLTAVSWDQYGSSIIKPQVEQRFKDSWMDPQQLPLSELIALAGNVDQLWEKLRPAGVNLLSPEGKRKFVWAILEDWIIASLCFRGFQPVAQPGRALVLQRGTQIAYADELLAAAKNTTLLAETLKSFEPTELGVALQS